MILTFLNVHLICNLILYILTPDSGDIFKVFMKFWAIYKYCRFPDII